MAPSFVIHVFLKEGFSCAFQQKKERRRASDVSVTAYVLGSMWRSITSFPNSEPCELRVCILPSRAHRLLSSYIGDHMLAVCAEAV